VCNLLGDKGVGVGFGNVDAFADLAPHEFLQKLHKHRGILAWRR
jgi:hypothetical protein